ncbi:MAG: hypothetical protein KF887_10550 [Paracoccaceae bacterium]|nr:MAG: hypothetical protein KF887_10550 [Paracoccaceae bacterium]
MTVTVTVPPSIVNTAGLAGEQSNAKTLALPNGDFIVMWNDPLSTGGKIWMQRYDALGSAVGAVIDTNITGGTLHDLELTAAGTIVFAFSFSSFIQVRHVDPVTLAQTSFLGLSIPGTTVNGAQLDATTGDVVRVTYSTADGVLRVSTADPTQSSLTSTSIITTFTAGTSVREVVATTNPTHDFALVSNGTNGTVIDPSGSSIAGGPFSTATDILLLQPGLYVIMSSVTNSHLPRLTATFDDGTNLAGYAIGPTVVAAQITGTGTLVDATITAREMVNLGDGRILMIWGAFRGNGTFTGQSGIYASVYNAHTGNIEAAATLLRAIGQLSELQGLTILATMLADGRVAVTYSAPNGLMGSDVFRLIVDPRVTGVTVTASAGADAYVGSAFDDTFLSVNANDTIFGGAGSDAVVMTGNIARTIDLANSNAFPGGPYLDSIENLTTGNGADVLFGTAGANVLHAGGGADHVVGRAGDDSLIGGNGDDTLEGGQGADTLDGGQNNDLMFGGAGADVLFGGLGDDTIRGGADNDLLQGGDGNDVIDGGAGDDSMFGGAGNDTLVTGDGDDLVFGGDGNDVIFVTGTGNVIAGDAGNDTASYARTQIGANQEGVYADLTGSFDPLAALAAFAPDGNTFTGIENLTGSQGNDFLAGDAAANRLVGGAGDDILFGRGGADTLVGGLGADTFVFDAAGNNNRVRDFTPGVDRIGLVLDAFGDIDAGNIAARFTGSANATPAANGAAQLLFDNAGGGAGRVFFDADGNGAGAAVLIATLQFTTADGLTTFGAGDFVFL